MKCFKVVMFLMLSLSILMCSGVYAGIGVYKVSVDPYLPANISYMLNGDAASVTVSMLPAGGGVAVWTQTYTAPATQTLRGTHTVVWDGTGGTPGASYNVAITATGKDNPAGKLTPLWETRTEAVLKTTIQYYQIAVNNNPNSQYYGRIYVCNYMTNYKKIEMYEPDGTYIGKMNDTGIAWGGSAPWGIAIDAHDFVWVSDRSGQGLYRFAPDGSSYLGKWNWWKDPILPVENALSCYSRGIAVDGTGSDFRIVDFHWNNDYSQDRAFTAVGEDITTGLLGTAGVFWKAQAGSVKIYGMQPVLRDGKVIYCGLQHQGGNGGLFQYDFADGSVTSNTAITRVDSLAYASDGRVYVGRMANTPGANGAINYPDPDSTAVYALPSGTDIMTATAANGTALSIATANATSTVTAVPLFLSSDGFGNVALTAGQNTATGPAYYFGLYAPPGAGTPTSATRGPVTAAYQPRITAVDADPAVVTVGGSTSVRVTVEDLSGYEDVAAVNITVPYRPGGPVTFNGVRESGGGNQCIWRVDINAQVGDKAGLQTAVIKACGQTAPVPPCYEKNMSVRVIDATVNGHVNASVLSTYSIEGVTVTADAGDGEVHTALTNASGDYTMDVTGGKTYSISTSKNGWANTNGTQATVAHQATATHNAVLNPLNVRDTIVVGDNRRPEGQFVAVAAVVMRRSAKYGSGDPAPLLRTGMRDYYALSDDAWNGTQQGCLISQRADDPYFEEGDKVLVEGIWTINSGDKDGYVLPTKTPILLSSGNSYPAPVPFYWNNAPQDFVAMDGDKTWGRYVTVTGIVTKVDNPLVWDSGQGPVTYRFSTFTIDVPTSPTDPALKPIRVEVDTAASTGITMPAVDDAVTVTGIVGWTNLAWGFWQEPTSNVIRVAKAEDVVAATAQTDDWGSIKNLMNGYTVTFDTTASTKPPVITTWKDMYDIAPFCYIEDAEKKFGIKVETNSLVTPSSIGEAYTYVKGKLKKDQVTGERVLSLLEAPTASGTGSVTPYYLLSKSVGGATAGYTGGITAGTGPANAGLVVKLSGVVSKSTGEFNSDEASFSWYLNDGSSCANDTNGAVKGIKILEQDGFPTEGAFVTVTGVIALRRYDPDPGTAGDEVIIPVILVRDYLTDVKTYP